MTTDCSKISNTRAQPTREQDDNALSWCNLTDDSELRQQILADIVESSRYNSSRILQ